MRHHPLIASVWKSGPKGRVKGAPEKLRGFIVCPRVHLTGYGATMPFHPR